MATDFTRPCLPLPVVLCQNVESSTADTVHTGAPEASSMLAVGPGFLQSPFLAMPSFGERIKDQPIVLMPIPAAIVAQTGEHRSPCA
jgi:hypothetical protein